MTTDAEIPLTFRIDEDLVVKAAGLNAERYHTRIVWFALTVGLMTAGGFIYAGGVWNLERALVQIVLTVAGALIVTLLVVGTLRAIVIPMQARRNFRQQKALAQEIRLSWTDDEFHYGAGKSQTVMPFADLYGTRSSAHLLLLYTTDVLYYLVPVAAFGDKGAFDAFMRRLDNAGVRRL